MAEKWPDHDHVGIEVRRRYVYRFAQLHGRPGSTARNVRVIWADAKRVTGPLFAQQKLDAIFINFPDPWWKKRHHKRRLVQTDFAQDDLPLTHREARCVETGLPITRFSYGLIG
jgi:tRNA (guanine-N7-)-methyltransferase